VILDGVEGVGQRLLVGRRRGPRDPSGHELREHRAEPEADAVDGLDRPDEVGDVELDVGQSGGPGMREPLRRSRCPVDESQLIAGCAEETELEQRPAAETFAVALVPLRTHGAASRALDLARRWSAL